LRCQAPAGAAQRLFRRLSSTTRSILLTADGAVMAAGFQPGVVRLMPSVQRTHSDACPIHSHDLLRASRMLHQYLNAEPVVHGLAMPARDGRARIDADAMTVVLGG
jgi:hypothetical protein